MIFYEDLINKYFFYPEKKKKYYFIKIYNRIRTIDDMCDFAAALYVVDVSWKMKESLLRDIWRYEHDKFYIKNRSI